MPRRLSLRDLSMNRIFAIHGKLIRSCRQSDLSADNGHLETRNVLARLVRSIGLDYTVSTQGETVEDIQR